jgi:hypothetical protein
VKIINTNSNEIISKTNEDSVSKQNQNTESSYIVMVGDTTVRLNFKGKGDITARLAAAFNTMQG